MVKGEARIRGVLFFIIYYQYVVVCLTPVVCGGQQIYVAAFGNGRDH